MGMVMCQSNRMAIIQKNSMKFSSLFSVFACAIFLVSCVSTKSLKFDSVKKEANALFSQEKYNEALALYNTVDSLCYDSILLHNACLSALKTDQFPVVLKYLKAYKGAENDVVVKNELSALLDSMERFSRSVYCFEDEIPTLKRICGEDYTNEKFALYYSYINSSKVVDLYDKLVSKEVRSACFPTYFSNVKNNLEEKILVDKCKSALADNENQVVALKYLGVVQYNKSERDYKNAMDEYNKNKNQTTYAYLRRDLKVISKDYIKSRDYLNKVHALDPDDVQVIKILININNRLDQPAKAKALQKLLK